MKLPLALLALGALLLTPSSVVLAQVKPPVPELINQGLNAYAQSGLNTALQIWLQNSLLDRGTLLRSELAALKQADATYGLFESGEVMRVAIITPRVTRVYLVLYYERAPLWAWFDLYQTRSGKQVISDVFFSPKIQVILPPDLAGQ
ncbi:MAG: hypothetical protein K0R17_602 [Rariglobus sp.]|jgi:hypothetical protein|nr:hypothetical protein [Rariglobus sp.]